MKRIYFFLFWVIIFSGYFAHADDTSCESHVYCDDYESCLKDASKKLDDVDSYQKEFETKSKNMQKKSVGFNTESLMKYNEATLENVSQLICAAIKFNEKAHPSYLKRNTRIVFLKIKHAFLKKEYENVILFFEKEKKYLNNDAETIDAYFFAGISYFEIGKYNYARDELIEYIKKGLSNPVQYDLKKIMKAYFYAGSSLQNESNKKAQQIFDDLTTKVEPLKLIEKIQGVDISKSKKIINKWINKLKTQFDIFSPEKADIRIKYFFKHHTNINLLPDEDDLPVSTAEISELHSNKSDEIQALQFSAKYHLIEKDKHKAGINGMYYENFHNQKKEYDFRGFSTRMFYEYTLSSDLTLDSNYAFSKYCVNSKNYQSSHSIESKLKWKFILLAPEIMIDFKFKTSFIDDYQMDSRDGKYTVFGTGIRNLSNLSKYLKNIRFQMNYQHDNRSTDKFSDNSFSGFQLGFAINYINLLQHNKFLERFFLFQHADLFCSLNYRKRIFDQDDQFFAGYREEKKKVIKAGINWYHFDDALTYSFSVKHTKNDASIQFFEYNSTEWLLTAELRPLLLYKNFYK